MDHIRITGASDYVLALLRTHTRGTVHSVYRKTVNLLLKSEPSCRLPTGSTSVSSSACSLKPEPSCRLPRSVSDNSVPAPADISSETPFPGAFFAHGTASRQPQALYMPEIPAAQELCHPAAAGPKPQTLHMPEVLVALQAAGSPLSPISLITELSGEQMAALQILAGMDVSIDAAADPTNPGSSGSTALSVGSCCRFCVCAKEPVNLSLDHAFPENELAILTQNIRGALSLRDAGSFDLLFTAPERAGEVFFLTAALKRLEETRTALEQKQYVDAARSLGRLIGLGTGLTPGGDDFLCGALAGLTLCGLRGHAFAAALRSEISAHLEDTNKISAAFLASALENQFSQAIKVLHPCCCPEKILHVFRDIGHSSGTDSLCGVFFILLLRSVL